MAINAEDIIKMSLKSNQDFLDNRRYISTALNQVTSGGGLPEAHGHALTEGGHGESPYSADNPYGLEPELYRRIMRLNEMSPFGPNTVTVGSGYRSFEEQARLYQDWQNGVPGQARAAPPGRSNHNHGTAADLEYASEEAKRWVQSVARELGLHFPVEGEDWHVERYN
jgi:LAS superfamily LD-carboxypeptidase LdcB